MVAHVPVVLSRKTIVGSVVRFAALSALVATVLSADAGEEFELWWFQRIRDRHSELVSRDYDQKTETKGYWHDRLADLSDILHIDATAVAAGAVLNAGPAVVGTMGVTAPDGDGMRVGIGLGGPRKEIRTSGMCGGAVWPISKLRERNRSLAGYGRDAPGWGSIGGDIGIAWAVGLRFDVVEFVDFLVGFTGQDVVEDDDTTANRLFEISETEPAKKRFGELIDKVVRERSEQGASGVRP